MSATSLSQFLQSLCFKSPWNYAVFWKLQHQFPMVLTWEDGQYNTEPKRSLIDDGHIKGLNEVFSPNCLSRSQTGNLSEHPIGLVLVEMSSTYHLAGKGAIGEVASLCSPRWISADLVAAGELSLGTVSEFPDEWLLQFVAGIKTILLVPCIPHGVLQLGSMETVAENMEVVTDVAEAFDAHIKFVENLLPGGESFLRSAPSATTTNTVNEDEVTADLPILKDHKLSTSFPLASLLEVQDSFQLSDKHMPNVITNANESKINIHHAEMIDLVKQLNHQLSDDNGSGLTENSLGRSSCHSKNVDAFSYSNCTFGGVDVFNEADFYFDGDMLDLGNDHSDTILTNTNNTNQCINNLSGFSETTASKLFYVTDCMFNDDPSFGESNGWHHKQDNSENLLEAVVASASCISDSLYRMTGLESLNKPVGKPLSFCKKQNQPTESTFNEGHHETKVTRSLTRQRESKVSNTNKKRGRSGDSYRPRPRDRQLIQDRLKELRQLVPNGAKCSIDGLLDKTIRHMLFLRSVTDQADKLRCQVQIEVSPEKSPQSPELKTSCEQGTCWALELGSEDQICPIIVKDLDYPGRMLIEMMCDDHGRFLEIADIIHRSELTILKGVMEERSESTWAHFIVEASVGNFHRLDIFWPLMQLLQQTPGSITRKRVY